MKKIISVLLFIIMSMGISVNAQRDNRIKNHNLIFNADLGFGSPYSFALSSIATGLANYYLFDDAFFENAFMYSLYSAKPEGIKARTMNPMGLTARELFNNVQAGLKIGYQTYSPETFNFGIYGSAHYKLDQFEVGSNDDNMAFQRANRILIGATALFSLGSMDKASRVIIEVGERYSCGISYKSPLSDSKDQLNDGFISHFAVKLASRGLMQDVGVFVDINHFNLWKDYLPGYKLNDITFGLSWKITPQQADSRKDW